jgi:hypothetical protein
MWSCSGLAWQAFRPRSRSPGAVGAGVWLRDLPLSDLGDSPAFVKRDGLRTVS